MNGTNSKMKSIPTPNFSSPLGVDPTQESVRWFHLTHTTANAGESVLSDLDASQMPFCHNSYILMSVASWTKPTFLFLSFLRFNARV